MAKSAKVTITETDCQKFDSAIHDICQAIHDEMTERFSTRRPKQEDVESFSKYAEDTLTAESRMLLSTVYDMLRRQTLKQPLYKENADNKTAFNRRDIFQTLRDEFVFTSNDIAVGFILDPDSLTRRPPVDPVVAGEFAVFGGELLAFFVPKKWFWVPIVTGLVSGVALWAYLKHKRTARDNFSMEERVEDEFGRCEPQLTAFFNQWLGRITERYNELLAEFESEGGVKS